MEWAEELTAGNDRITLFVPFNYGGRAEIVRARAAFRRGDEEEFRAGLYAPEMHDPELLIRTGGERRLSNYLLWQMAESELVFSDELWPDFSRGSFEAAIEQFRRRCRRPIAPGRAVRCPTATAERSASGSDRRRARRCRGCPERDLVEARGGRADWRRSSAHLPEPR